MRDARLREKVLYETLYGEYRAELVASALLEKTKKRKRKQGSRKGKNKTGKAQNGMEGIIEGNKNRGLIVEWDRDTEVKLPFTKGPGMLMPTRFIDFGYTQAFGPSRYGGSRRA